MFAGVPGSYDLLNRVFTFGFDQRWRRCAVEECLFDRPRRVLDLCSGTGDLAVMLSGSADPGASVVAADFSEPMLAVARAKAESAGVAGRIEFRVADAAALPFADGEFDAAGIAFGFRNLTWKNPGREKHLAEVRRVLAHGARFVVVETSRPPFSALRTGFDAWMAAAVAPLGGLISGQGGAYRYLARSARGFYRADEVDALLLGAGFRTVQHRLFLGGVAALHVAVR
ncbi:MAG: ubiquinone/menaquinone biosynthesis methyltransferase [Deltaproteobacteria bacterium]|nr:ubiquinone/menaquinone biosynthesis methyltransferase [Deltaproteobacteria bacterium]